VKVRVVLGERDLTVDVPDLPDAPWRVDGAAVPADVRRVAPGIYSVIAGGRSFEVVLEDGEGLTSAAAGEATRLSVDGRTAPVTVEDARRRAVAGAGGGAAGARGGLVSVVAPMPGRVVAVPVAPGDQVERGQTVVVLEAMKMESALASPHAGRVAEVLVGPGQTVQQRQVLVRVDG
jgi:biotin carboxyl carrier protein